MSAVIEAQNVSKLLAEHPQFGDASAMRRRAAEVLDFTLEILSDSLAPAGPAIAAGALRIRQERLYFDPVVRDILEVGLRELKCARRVADVGTSPSSARLTP
ncbi:hypothetical protein AB0A69_06705 [Streptomyces sp. NPDC045431]|uniref:hypothetical protein n=1 Tax=Streptomyces sp. NPDC045431 TaxID=3155613 RepID=UPI0033E1F4D1